MLERRSIICHCWEQQSSVSTPIETSIYIALTRYNSHCQIFAGLNKADVYSLAQLIKPPSEQTKIGLISETKIQLYTELRWLVLKISGFISETKIQLYTELRWLVLNISGFISGPISLWSRPNS